MYREYPVNPGTLDQYREGSERFFTDKILLNCDAVAKKHQIFLCDIMYTY